MPRKKKPDINDLNSKAEIFKDVYGDAFAIKTASVNAMRKLSREIDYTNKEEVIQLLPIVQEHMRLIHRANDTILDLEHRVNENELSNS